ncbi:hypothetical protein C9446_13495 [Providencia heimbachae]|uniref:hypothetical protein n=1 Tax=Providencia TaxID=586 RepID=UPI0010BEE8E4|nr:MULTISPECIES: hypothetical protein [Providencia]QCJ70773.1 hypothetical protein C9446_13495 [Providencia heimbachae]UBX48271.1 hypothetical protein LDO51_14030 [Providencia alcalifaciens]
MININKYGFERVLKAQRIRQVAIEGISDLNSRIAREAAWDAFLSDQLDLNSSRDVMKAVARVKFVEAERIHPDLELDMDWFVFYFCDEVVKIITSITKKTARWFFLGLFLFIALIGITILSK